MSQRSAADFLEVGERTSRRWSNDQLDVPLAVMLALELMLEHRVTPDEALALVHKGGEGGA